MGSISLLIVGDLGDLLVLPGVRPGRVPVGSQGVLQRTIKLALEVGIRKK